MTLNVALSIDHILRARSALREGGGRGGVVCLAPGRQEVGGVPDDARDAELGWVSLVDANGLDVGDVGT
jgi:hypothetical protein